MPPNHSHVIAQPEYNNICAALQGIRKARVRTIWNLFRAFQGCLLSPLSLFREKGEEACKKVKKSGRKGDPGGGACSFHFKSVLILQGVFAIVAWGLDPMTLG